MSAASFPLLELPTELLQQTFNLLDRVDLFSLRQVSEYVEHNARVALQCGSHLRDIEVMYTENGLGRLVYMAKHSQLFRGLQKGKMTIRFSDLGLFYLDGGDEKCRGLAKCRIRIDLEWEAKRQNEDEWWIEHLNDEIWTDYQQYSTALRKFCDERRDRIFLVKALTTLSAAGLSLDIEFGGTNLYQNGKICLGWRPTANLGIANVELDYDDCPYSIGLGHVIPTVLEAAAESNMPIESIRKPDMDYLDMRVYTSLGGFSPSILNTFSKVKRLDLSMWLIRLPTIDPEDPDLADSMITFLSAFTSLEQLGLRFDTLEDVGDEDVRDRYVPNQVLRRLTFPKLQALEFREMDCDGDDLYRFLERHPGLRKLNFYEVTLKTGNYIKFFDLFIEMHSLNNVLFNRLYHVNAADWAEYGYPEDADPAATKKHALIHLRGENEGVRKGLMVIRHHHQQWNDDAATGEQGPRPSSLSEHNWSFGPLGQEH